MVMILFAIAFFGWFIELSSQFILIILMIYTWIMEFFIGKMDYQIYTGDVSEELCSICLDDFSKTIPVTLPVCSGPDKASRYFRLRGINTNRYDIHLFNDHLRNFEYR